MQDIISQFIDSMRVAGCAPHNPAEIVADDKPHRYKLHNDKGSKKSASYALAIEDDFGYGWFINFREGITHKFSSKNAKPMSAKERKDFEIRLAEKKAVADAEILHAQQAAGAEARELWAKATTALEHPYLTRKQAQANGARVFEGDLIIPIYIDGKIVNLQKITENGDKYFMPRAELKGGYFPIANKEDDKSIVYMCEGFATGDAVRQATGAPVIVAFNAGNLMPVAKAMRIKYPAARIIIAADNDQWTHINGKPYNTGMVKAKEAALEIGGFVVFPDFSVEDEKKRTDFNDLFCDFGIESVKERLSFAAQAVDGREGVQEISDFDFERDTPLPDSLDGFERDYDFETEKVIKKTDWAFKCLGYDKGIYFFLSEGANQIVRLTPSAMTDKNLLTLAPLAWWCKDEEFAEFDEEGGLKKIKWMKAAAQMIDKCHSKGVFNPDDRQRGAGMWKDKGDVVVHCGDKILFKQQAFNAFSFESYYIYEAAVKRFELEKTALTNKESQKLYDILQRPSWVNPAAGKILCGWIVASIACGCLDWRPHIWIMGEHGAGKSYIIKEILTSLLQGVAQFHGAGSTEAGIRQSINHDALPVIMDEMENESMRDNEILQSILAMSRRSSSGQSLTKGSADGNAQSFTLMSAFCFASINHGIVQGADETRISILEIKKDRRTDAKERFDELEKLVEETITPDFRRKLLRRIVNDIPYMIKNIKLLSKEIRKQCGDSRTAQQLSPLIAGVYSLVNGGEIPQEKIPSWVEMNMLKGFVPEDAKKDHERLFDFLMTTKIRVVGNIKTHETQIGRAITIALGYNVEGEYTKQEARVALDSMDIKVRETVWIRKQSQHIKKILNATPWSASWARVLIMNDGIKELDKQCRIGGSSTKAIEIDPSLFDESEPFEEVTEIAF